MSSVVSTIKISAIIGVLSALLTFYANDANAGFVINRPLYIGLGSGLVGHWSFDGPDMNATQARDASGNGNHGALTNGPVRTIGRIGQALKFDGVDDLVDMGDVLDITSANLTITAWFYPRSLGEASEGRIVDKQQGATSGYRLQLDTNNSLTFRVSGTKRTSNSSVITLNAWQHVVVTYNGSNVRFYVNSTSAGTVAETTVPSANTESLTVGNRVNTAVTFDGLIDDVRIYNRALSSDDIKRLYKIGGSLKLLSYGPRQQVTVDNVSSAGTAGNQANITFSHQVSANGSNRLLLVGASAKNITVSSVTYSSQSLTKVCSQAESTDAANASLWRLLNPPVGTADVVVTFSANGKGAAGALTLLGVDQANPFGTCQGAWANSVLPSVTVTSLQGELVVDALSDNIEETSTVGDLQTSRWDTGDSGVGTIAGAGSTEPGAASVIMSWRLGGAQKWALVAVPVKPIKILSRVNTSQTQKLTDGLVGYWSFDGPDMNATQARDASGNANHGTLTNGPTRAIGRIGQALEFDGGDDLVDAGSGASSDNLGPMSVSAWIKPDSQGEGNAGAIVFKGTATASGFWRLALTTTNAVQFVKDYATSDLTRTSSNNTIGLGAWQHIMVTWDDSDTAANVKIYRNGTEVSYQTTTDGAGAQNSDADLNLFLGNDSAAGVTFTGLIDEARVYNRALNSDEIKRLYSMGR